MPKMRQILLGLLAILFLFHSDLSTSAQDNHDNTPPQETYLQIYLSIQEAERLESSNQFAEARARYQKCLEQLQQLQHDFPEWEQVIVRYRINFCKEKLDRLPKTDNTGTTSAADNATPVVVAPSPNPNPNPNIVTNPDVNGSTNTPTPAPRGIATNTPTPFPTPDPDDIPLLRQRIRDLTSQLETTKKQLSDVTTENSALKSHQQELEDQIAKLRADTSGEAKYNDLLAENKKLQDQLAQIKTSGMSSDDFKKLQDQLAQTQAKLDDATKQAATLQASNDDYSKQLETLKAQLDASQKHAKDLEPLAQENGILRDIVNRTLRDQARRDAAGRLAEEELKSLKVDSATLKTQIDILTSPVVVLKPEERDILRAPTVQVSIDSAGGTIATPLNQVPGDYSSKPRVPPEFKDVADQAVKLFASRQFDAAAAKYQIILNAYPESLYALSNLGVVRFQQGNYPDAEKLLREAVRVAPQDAFSHSILGIVLYQEGKYDEAVSVLTRAVALDPNDPKSRNYLGISASQKGWQESAEQELRKAIELDPNYGDAHFNLAVIYATQKPPALELARRDYNRALELGIPRDEQLEKIINPPKQ